MTIEERIEQAKFQAVKLEEDKHFFIISPVNPGAVWSQADCEEIAKHLQRGVVTLDPTRQEDYFFIMPQAIEIEAKSFREIERVLGLIFQMNGWRRPE